MACVRDADADLMGMDAAEEQGKLDPKRPEYVQRERAQEEQQV